MGGITGAFMIPTTDPPFLLLREVYDSVSPGWRGRCTAPLLVDRLERRIISNESADIVVALNALRLPGCTTIELRPEAQKAAMEKLCEQVQTFKGGEGGHGAVV